MPQQIQLRNGTAAAWTSANTVLAIGEVGTETDTHKLKIGDGVTAWNSLAYASGTSTFAALTDAVTATIATTNTSVANAIAAITPNAPITVTVGFTFSRSAHANRRIGYNSASAGNATFDGTAAFTNGDKFKLIQEGVGTVTLLASGISFGNPRLLPLVTTGLGTYIEAEWDTSIGQLIITSVGTLVTLGSNTFTGTQYLPTGTYNTPSLVWGGSTNPSGINVASGFNFTYNGVDQFKMIPNTGISTIIAGTGFLTKEGSNCKQGATNLTPALVAPVQTTPSTSTTGGTLAAATYYYVITAINSIGEGVKSNELSITTTGTTSSNTVNWIAITAATGYRIYRGTVAGAEGQYYSVGTVTSFVDTGTTGVSASVPTSDTSGGCIVANTSVTANSRIFLTGNADGGTPGFLRVSSRVAGTSFTVRSSSPSDASVFVYEIFEPA